MSIEETLDPDSEDKMSSLLAGISGEYFVAAELSRRGFIASITLRNSRGIDILTSNAEASRSVAIQVKTNQRGNREWILSNKAENFHSENHFYVFVNLNGLTGSPNYFVVPSKIVSEYTTRTHAEWLGKPGKDGRTHQDSSIRKFTDLEGQYLNRWDLLGLKAAV